MGGWRGRGRKSISIDIIITVTGMSMGRDEGAIRMERRKIAADRAMVIGIVIAIGGGRELPEYPGYRQGYNYDNGRQTKYASKHQSINASTHQLHRLYATGRRRCPAGFRIAIRWEQMA